MTFPKPADYPFWFRLVVVITLALFTVNLFFFLGPTLTFATWAAANVGGFTAWLQKWQTMASASVALGAAFLAFHNTTRSIRGAREQETHRRKRKQSAVRAVLPIALSDLTSYAEQSANQLNKVSPTMGMTDSRIEPIPTKAIETFADFIEYSDAVDVAVVEATTAFVQIFNSRLRALTDADTPTTQWEIAARILDARVDLRGSRRRLRLRAPAKGAITALCVVGGCQRSAERASSKASTKTWTRCWRAARN
jgi:hypothetical protein